jgi:biopolymer transport protein ExbD
MPLVDVLLVLIITFMVVVPRHEVGLRAVLPQPATDTPRMAQPDVVVSVNQDHSITINSEPISIDRLRERLLAIFASRSSKVIFVRGHRDLEFQAVASVIDIAKETNVLQVGLMTE